MHSVQFFPFFLHSDLMKQIVLNGFGYLLSKCGPQTCNIIVPLGFVKKANPQLQSETH
jgi:hypothetical protein